MPAWRKAGLLDGNVGLVDQCLDAGDGGQAVVVEAQRCQFEHCVVPGHVGVVPRHPGDLCAVGLPAGVHVKVLSVGQFLRPLFALRVDDRQAVCAFVGVYKHDPFAVGREGGRGHVAELRGDRFGRSAGKRLPPQPSFLGDKVDVSMAHAEIAAAIADPRPHRECRGQVARRLSGRRAGQHAAARASFEPDEGIGVPGHVGETQALGQAGRLDRAGPKAVLFDRLRRHSRFLSVGGWFNSQIGSM